MLSTGVLGAGCSLSRLVTTERDGYIVHGIATRKSHSTDTLRRSPLISSALVPIADQFDSGQ